ncbi:MAG: hypothetical protein PGN20_08955 [Agrobacterium cavarae]
MKKTVFQSFLQKNSISPTEYLPIVHSSEAHVISKCLEQGIIKRTRCEVFNEDLLYFFVGRPSYKKLADKDAEYWELPSCVVFDFTLKGAKRAYPFDTGAFQRRKYPSFVNMMPMDEYEIEPSPENIKRAIGAFFQDPRSYYRLTPYSENDFSRKHELDPTEAEIKALYKLIKTTSNSFDDRRFSIEIQFQNSFYLENQSPIFCVVPETYLESEKFMGWADKYETVVETYPVYPLRADYYYAAIYEKIEGLYRKNGYYEVQN